jgi:hypothetical protein
MAAAILRAAAGSVMVKLNLSSYCKSGPSPPNPAGRLART